jgi:hypothetical protein
MNLTDILNRYQPISLQALARLCGQSPATATDAADLVRRIAGVMTSPAGLQRQWSQLDDLSRKAVSLAAHNNGEFDAQVFVARYGRLPERPPAKYAWQPVAIGLDLFLHYNRIPDDLLPLLEAWVPRPEPFQIAGVTRAPETTIVKGRPLALRRADTEQAGLHDLATLLRLAEDGALFVSSSTQMPTRGAVKQLLPLLHNGDFLELPADFKAADAIRPVGLTAFAIGGGLVEISGGGPHDRLWPTEAGRAWLRSQDPALLLEAFERWTTSAGFDELARVRAIRGQRASGASLSQPGSRREKIIEALSWCPVGVWIDVEDFFRAVLIWHFNFDAHEANFTWRNTLSIGREPVSSTTHWRAVNGLNILAVLWDRLASIGALDILYLPPETAGYDAHVYYPDAPYFSLCDGLKYFRINGLGAYLLGQHAEFGPPRTTGPYLVIERLAGYSPGMPASETFVLEIPASVQVSAADQLALGQVAEPQGERRFQISLESLLAALERGHDLDASLAFLAEKSTRPLTPELALLFADALGRSKAFATPEPALFVEARTAEIAQLVMQDPKLKRICKLVGDRTIALPASRRTTLRTRLRELGYLLP